MKKTDWFGPDVKPVHVGVYERQYGRGNIYFTKWNGFFWAAGCSDVETANRQNIRGIIQSLPWRGLTEEVKA